MWYFFLLLVFGFLIPAFGSNRKSVEVFPFVKMQVFKPIEDIVVVVCVVGSLDKETEG